MKTVNSVRHAVQEGKILDSAQSLFAEKGYKETGMKDIAAACDLTKATLYHYFDGKHAILLALLHQGISCSNLELKRVWCAGTLREALEAVAVEYFHVSKKLNVHEMFAIFLSESGKRKEVGELFHHISEKYENDFLEGVIRHGLIRPEEEVKLKTALYPFFGALFRYNFDQILYGKASVWMSQEKFGSYMASVAVESLKCAVAN